MICGSAAPQPVLSEVERRRGYLVFQRPITEPVFAETHPLPNERVEQLTAFATPGEFEPVTLSVYPVRDLVDFTVEIGGLRSALCIGVELRARDEAAIRYRADPVAAVSPSGDCEARGAKRDDGAAQTPRDLRQRDGSGSGWRRSLPTCCFADR